MVFFALAYNNIELTTKIIKLFYLLQTQPVILDTLTPIDEDIEEENEEDIPEIVETAPSPLEPPEKEIKQIESVL